MLEDKILREFLVNAEKLSILSNAMDIKCSNV